MNIINTAIVHTLLRFEINMPDINPDFSAPFMKGLQQAASWVFGTSLVLAFMFFILCWLMLTLKGISHRLRELAGAAIGWAILGLVGLGSISGIFQWVVGFDLGF